MFFFLSNWCICEFVCTVYELYSGENVLKKINSSVFGYRTKNNRKQSHAICDFTD